jgi:RHS repeat-associated protein
MIKLRFCGVHVFILPFLALLTVAFFGDQTIHAQGIIPFSTQATGPISSVDMASSNIVFSFPVRNKIGAIPFEYAILGNFPPNPANFYGTNTIGFSGTMIGAGSPVSVSYSGSTNTSCGTPGKGQYYTRLYDFFVTDSTGASHGVSSGDYIYVSQYTGTGCKNSGSFSNMTGDESGYTLTVTAGPSGSGGWSATVTDVSGNTVLSGAGGEIAYTNSVSDPDGNTITGTSGATITDTLAEVALTTNALTTYTYTDQNGNNQTFTVGETNVHWKTNFGGGYSGGPCTANIDETNVPMPTSITQNTTGQQYLITYEPTPGYSGDVTGRVQQITFPSGGYVKYTYSGGNNGLNCNTGVIPTITKTVSDNNGHISTWTYVNNYNQTYGTTESSAYTVTETDPAGNQTVYTLWGEYQLEKQSYQGTTGSGTLLSTTVTCYNGNFSNCTTPTTEPTNGYGNEIIQTDVFTYPGGSNAASLVETKYNTTGTVAEVKQYDFGAATALPPTGAPGTSPLSDETITYDGTSGPCGALTVAIYNKPCSDTVNGPSGIVSQVNYTYNGTGHPTQTSKLVSGSTYLTSTATYNSNGSLASSTDVNGATSHYGYNCNNLLLTSTSLQNGLSTSQTWDCNGGVLTSVADANGESTTYGYQTPGDTADPFWRALSVTDPLGNITRTTYSATAPFTQETSLQFNGGASGSDVLTTLDGLYRPVFVQTRQAPGSSTFDSVQTTYGWTSNAGSYTTTSVPYAGSQAQTAPGGTAVTTAQLDAIGRPLSTVDGGGGTTAYSYTNRDTLITISPAPTGENTKRHQLEVDGLGRLTSVCELTAGTTAWPGGTCAQSLSQTGYWTKYTYDPLGDLLTVTQNAQSTSTQTRTYTYDGLQRRTSDRNPEAAQNVISYTYDTDSTCTPASAGDLVKKIDGVGNTICYAYDSLHRLTGVTYPSGPYALSTLAKNYVYDSAVVDGQTMQYAKGHLANAYTGTTGARTTDLGFSYTARGDTSDVYEATPNSSGYYHVNQTYWANGIPDQLSDLSGLPTIINGVDGEGRVKQITASTGQNPVTAATYNNASLPTSVSLGSGDSDSFGYDPNTLRMTQYKFTVGASPQSLTGSLTWNANSTLQQLAIADPFNSADAQTCNYSHDDLIRVATANCGTAAAQTFSYDPFGNIDYSGSPYSFQPTYSATTNRMTSLGGYAPTYDANGNLTNDSVTAYSWDANGNAISVNGVTATYDALGRMVEQNRSGAHTQIVYAPSGGKVALMSGQALQKAFIGLPGQATAVYTGSGLNRYRHSDWLGSARLISSPTQTVLSTSAYTPFGDPYAQSGTADPSFTGQNQDTSSGIYDFPAREYNPEGRWPSPDPSGLQYADLTTPQSLNLYAYVQNNPLRFTDPTGLVLCDWGSSDFGGEDYDDDADCGADGGTVVTDATTVTVNGDDSGDFLETLQDGGESSFIEYQKISGRAPNNGNQSSWQQKMRQASHYICGTSPGDRVAKSVLTGAGIGAVTGGFGGFVAGEVFGGEVTFGLTGIPGAYIGAHIGAAVGAVNGLGQGAVLAGICYAGFQYDN